MTERKKPDGANRRGPRKGPPPLPTPLRLLDGTATADEAEREVKPDATEVVRRPAWLKGEGEKLWRKLAPSLRRKGLLDVWNADVFAIWCNEVGNYISAARIVNDTAILARGHRNVLRKNPALSVQRDSVPAIRLLGAEFGLTPAARAGLDLIGELPLDAEVRKLLSG
jgi:P27 family predicted phage terminase small subunit